MNEEVQEIPQEFFPFTNYTDKDFTAKWNSVEYTFPAHTTKNLLGLIPSGSPEDVQYIRKKFARDLATLVWYEQDKYKYLEGQTPLGFNGSLQQAATYTDSDIAPFVQRCLEPLPIAKVIKTAEVKDDMEGKLSVNEDGKKNTRVIKSKTESLVKEAQEA